jgi:hypothetical protein
MGMNDMSVKDIVSFYCGIPINLKELSKYWPKIKTKRDLEFVVYSLETMIKNIKSGLNLLGKEK